MKMKVLDGSEAVAQVAYQLSEVVAIYPITPASNMGEFADQWSAEGRKNLWDSVPLVEEMQSEAGAAGALHGAVQAGALACTFTASQGLLLMIPNMYKLAGELSPAVIHVSARSIAAQALSIFGDHSDVMAVRGTGFAMLSSASVQEAQDLAAVAHIASLESRLPFVHFFDGFRTSHEINKIEILEQEQLRGMLDTRFIQEHRSRALTPDAPVIRGTAQNPDVYFQGRESVNPWVQACPEIVEDVMQRLGKATGRHYALYEYTGAKDAEEVLILMGSAVQAVEAAVGRLTEEGRKVGVLNVRLYRPFDAGRFLQALPASARRIAVLDRLKEPGCQGEPLYLDVRAAIDEAFEEGRSHFVAQPRVIGGRYGLSSKEFTPAMAKAVFDELQKERPKNHFTVGIVDDVTHTSLEVDPEFRVEDARATRAVFFGLGADGTVGANKNSIKIIGEETENHAQGYFVYDSKKSGSMTVSHLRFGPEPIRKPWLNDSAGFVACHQPRFLETTDMLTLAQPGATFLVNAPWPAEQFWSRLPRKVQEQILAKKLTVYTIDAVSVAQGAGMGGRINTVMQTCFFALSGVLPREEAIEAIKASIRKTYGRRGEELVQRNFAAVDAALEHLHEVALPAAPEGELGMRDVLHGEADEFLKTVTARIIAGEGNELPVSALPADGTWPVSTTRLEKRDIATHIPGWEPDLCIQCGKCVMVCPHAVIRSKVVDPAELASAPEGFQSATPKWPAFKEQRFTLQISGEDCTGCAVCVEVCPAKDKSQLGRKAINMQERDAVIEKQKRDWGFFDKLPWPDRGELKHHAVKDLQLMEPLFEFSGACAGCGETPYLKLATQLFGDRMLVANATGCSSIYGGNLPTTPWAANSEGRGPSWSNSLFEDNAEFGLGMRLCLDKQQQYARELVARLQPQIGADLAAALLESCVGEEQLLERRQQVAQLKEKLAGNKAPEAQDLLALADKLAPKSVWIVGGDGWAYDIGYGGVDHVLASGANVNILVLDTEVYSNTGGQASKATPRAAVAKFAASGKDRDRKDLARMAMHYENVYVARVAMGASDTQVIKAFREAEAWDGPSLIIAYSHCIAHGFQLKHGMNQQKLAVESGYWPLFRKDPGLALRGKNPVQLDSREPKIPLKQFVYNESRYTMLSLADSERAEKLLQKAQHDVRERWIDLKDQAGLPGHGEDKGEEK